MQPGRIGTDRAGVGRRLQPQRDASRGRLRGAAVQHAAHRGGSVHRLLLHVERAGFQTGDVEQVVDHRQQMPAGGADAADAFALHVGQRPLGVELQHLGEAEDGIQRRAQLVAHAGDEFAARVVGAFGQRASLQSGAGAGPVGDVAPARHRAVAAAVGLARHGMALEDAPVGEFEGVERLDLGRLPPFLAALSQPRGVDHPAGQPVDEIAAVEPREQRFRQAPESGEPAVGEQRVAGPVGDDDAVGQRFERRAEQCLRRLRFTGGRVRAPARPRTDRRLPPGTADRAGSPALRMRTVATLRACRRGA